MKIEIRVESPGAQARLIRREAGECLVGSQGCAITLAYPTVSRTHGRIVIAEGTVTYFDLSSRNGSLFVTDGQRSSALPEVAMQWPQGTELHIGPFRLCWRHAEAAQDAQPGAAETLVRFATLYQRWLSEQPARARELLYDALHGNEAREGLVERIYNEFHGDGPLRAWLLDAGCREILANAFDEIYVDTGTGLTRSNDCFLIPDLFEAWALRPAHAAGRRLDLQNPICEATLASGARFHAVMAPVSARGLSLSIRRFGSAPVTEEQALGSGWVSAEALRLLKDAIACRRNIVISGGTSTGKTSLLNFLSGYLDPQTRLVTVEDTVELAPPVENLVQLQARGANADGIGQVTLRSLVQCALRMRPDRIVVGECRGAEVIEMLQALNTGHPGSLTTIHANSPQEALQRLELLALLGAPNLSIECIREWIRSSVDLIVQVERDPRGHRSIVEIAGRTGPRDGKETAYQPLYARNDRQVAADPA